MGKCAPVFQYKFHGGKNQIFRLRWIMAPFCSLTAAHSGQVVDVSGVSKLDGAAVIQYTPFHPPHGNQLFALQPVSPGSDSFYLVCQHSGKVLDIAGISLENRAPLMQYSQLVNGKNQHFRFHPADPSNPNVLPPSLKSSW